MPEMIKVNAILSDWFGVLHNDHQADYERSARIRDSLDKPPEQIAALNLALDEGRIGIDDFFRLYGQALTDMGISSVDPARVREQMYAQAYFLDKNLGFLATIASEVDNVPLVLVSNAHPDAINPLLDNQFNNGEEIFTPRELFDDLVISGVEGVSKPHPEIYRIGLERAGNPSPETTLFIDDNKDNLQTAKDLGVLTLHSVEPDDIAPNLIIVDNQLYLNS